MSICFTIFADELKVFNPEFFSLKLKKGHFRVVIKIKNCFFKYQRKNNYLYKQALSIFILP